MKTKELKERDINRYTILACIDLFGVGECGNNGIIIINESERCCKHNILIHNGEEINMVSQLTLIEKRGFDINRSHILKA